ncbi:MAG: hypothetical protein ABIO92_02250 [Chloroflexia bacterium]
MQIAPRGAAERGAKDVEVVTPRRARKRRGISPTAIIIAVVLTVLSLGAMFAVIGGFWPPRSTTPSVVPTPISPSVNGLAVEIVGAPRREGDQVFVKMRVTNNVKVPGNTQGTTTPNAPTPVPEPANLNNGSVKVFFYDKPSTDNARALVGSAIGNVIDLKYGESKQIEVVGAGVGEFCEGCYEAFPDTIWTDKDTGLSTATPGP